MKKDLDYYAQMHNLIMSEVNVKKISLKIANTEKGILELELPQNGTGKDYRFILDNEPVPDTTNSILMNKIGLGILENSFMDINK